jgi:hypothetical protein
MEDLRRMRKRRPVRRMMKRTERKRRKKIALRRT